MSIIFDALKKVEEDKKKAQLPSAETAADAPEAAMAESIDPERIRDAEEVPEKPSRPVAVTLHLTKPALFGLIAVAVIVVVSVLAFTVLRGGGGNVERTASIPPGTQPSPSQTQPLREISLQAPSQPNVAVAPTDNIPTPSAPEIARAATPPPTTVTEPPTEVVSPTPVSPPPFAPVQEPEVARVAVPRPPLSPSQEILPPAVDSPPPVFPTQPPSPVAQPPFQPAPVAQDWIPIATLPVGGIAPPDLKIDLINFARPGSFQQSVAVVNRKRVVEGDTVEGCIVKKIEKLSILFEYQENTFTVRLGD